MFKRKLLQFFLALSLICFNISFVFANPVLNQVVEGSATVHQAGPNTTIHQGSDKAIIHWDSFNIHSHETVHFQQPAGGITLNRINSEQGLSHINGRLTATGQIILINGAGIHFGPHSYVNVGGLIASTVDISNKNFLANKFHFDRPGLPGAAVVNQGKIKAADYGLVALIGSEVENHGYFEVRVGTVLLAEGSKVTLDLNGGQLIHYVVDDSVMDPLHSQLARTAENKDAIHVDHGQGIMHVTKAGRVLDSVINLEGVEQARYAEERQGMIILHAGSPELADTHSEEGYVHVEAPKHAGAWQWVADQNEGGWTLINEGPFLDADLEQHERQSLKSFNSHSSWASLDSLVARYDNQKLDHALFTNSAEPSLSSPQSLSRESSFSSLLSFISLSDLGEASAVPAAVAPPVLMPVPVLVPVLMPVPQPAFETALVPEPIFTLALPQAQVAANTQQRVWIASSRCIAGIQSLNFNCENNAPSD